MSFIRENTALTSNIPQLGKTEKEFNNFSETVKRMVSNFVLFSSYFDVGVCRASGEKVAIGMEIEGFDASSMPSQRAYHPRRLQIPHLDSSSSASRAHKFFRWGESHRFDGRCMAAQTL